MDKIVSLCKRRGFIFQSSEIYGGINGFWDYGPLGAELKRHVRDYWWRCMTQHRDDVVGLEATIIMHPKIWEASGHTSTFSDPLVDCKTCKRRTRADQVDELWAESSAYQTLEEIFQRNKGEAFAQDLILELKKWLEKQGRRSFPNLAAVKENRHTWSDQDWPNFQIEPESNLAPASAKALLSYLATSKDRLAARSDWVHGCPYCGGELTEPRPFNLMFKTYVGPVESEENVAYLRPETAQAIFAQFKNVLEVSRQKVPFGICQIGKAFRNEINPRNFTFRSREFEQMELEFFIKPDDLDAQPGGPESAAPEAGAPSGRQPNWGWKEWHTYWVEERIKWYESIGLDRSSLDLYWQKPEELAHYAKATVDILYKFPFGAQELEGIAARGDFDLTQHQKFSGKSMVCYDEESKMRYLPHVIEPSAGVDRLVLALICQAYHEEEAPDEKGQPETRVVMKFHPRIAPIKVGVFPLLKNRPELVKKSIEVRDLLRPHLTVFYDESGAIGRRYRRQDEAGTPFGVTIDFDTLGENPELRDTVTLRDRDSMKQIRVRIDELVSLLLEKIR